MISTFLHFFFNETAPTERYTYCHTLPLPAALPISGTAQHDRAHFAISAYGIDRDFELGEHLRIHRNARFRPIERQMHDAAIARRQQGLEDEIAHVGPYRDRKSTRLNSSH